MMQRTVDGGTRRILVCAVVFVGWLGWSAGARIAPAHACSLRDYAVAGPARDQIRTSTPTFPSPPVLLSSVYVVGSSDPGSGCGDVDPPCGFDALSLYVETSSATLLEVSVADATVFLERDRERSVFITNAWDLDTRPPFEATLRLVTRDGLASEPVTRWIPR